ncbi:MAG: glycosyltransferase [Oceanipulchritudo sp.]
MDKAELYLPRERFGMQLLSDLAKYASVKTLPIPWNPAFRFPTMNGTYDLFFANMTFSYDLEIIHRMPNWRKKVGYSICYIDEFFNKTIDQYPNFLPVLRKFDCIVLHCASTVPEFFKRTGLKAVGVRAGIDMLRFFPGTRDQSRVIEIHQMGNVPKGEHEKYKELRDKDGWFYLYDTLHPRAFIEYRSHRQNLAKRLSRTLFFTVNPAKFNRRLDTGKQDEIGFRYFEGAAGGTVMIGKVPQTPDYKEFFPWEDAVIELPGDQDQIPDFLRELRKDTDRLERISYDNVLGSLRRHDFAYRWEEILKVAGLEPLPALQKRREELARLEKEWIAAHS